MASTAEHVEKAPGAASDPCEEQRRISGPRDLVGFAASGGGYRAALFHLGSLIRLNELGWLSKIDRFSGVSGGSIALGALVAAWPKLRFEQGRALNFDEVMTKPLLAFTRRRIDIWASTYGLIPGLQSADFMKRQYHSIVGQMTLQDLPDHPQFVFNATSLQTGVTMRFTKAYLRDYRAGCIAHPQLELALAIAASSAFPPLLSPNVVRLPGSGLRPTDDPALADARFRNRLVLTDGGVYDNLGLQTLNSFRTILASDGGSPGKVEHSPNPLLQMLRVNVGHVGAGASPSACRPRERFRAEAARRRDLDDKDGHSPLSAPAQRRAAPDRASNADRVPRHRADTSMAVRNEYDPALGQLGTCARGRSRAKLDGRGRLGPSWPFPEYGLETEVRARTGAVATEGIE